MSMYREIKKKSQHHTTPKRKSDILTTAMRTETRRETHFIKRSAEFRQQRQLVTPRVGVIISKRFRLLWSSAYEYALTTPTNLVDRLVQRLN